MLRVAVKEIGKLRKFLHKNQQYRFAVAEQTKLMLTIGLYKAVPYLREASTELIGDALKMPFTVFTAKQKQTLVKWLDEVRSGVEGKPTPAVLEDDTESFICVDIDDDGFASLLNEDGTTRDAVQCEKPVADSIRQWLDDGEEVIVSIYSSNNTVADVRLNKQAAELDATD
jgi:hypothetical protein